MKCTRKKSVFIGALVLIVLIVWAYFVYDINAAYPSPPNKEYREGDTFDYYGIQVTAKELEVFDYEEFCRNIEGFREYSEGNDVYENSFYIYVHLHVENPANEDKNIKDYKDLTSWMLEVENAWNGVSQELISLTDYSRDIYKAGSNTDIVLPFYMYKNNFNYKTKDELLQHDIKIVTKYYPEKKYICYGGRD